MGGLQPTLVRWLDQLLLGPWDEDYYEYEGKYFSVPRRWVTPKPYSKPNPPIGVACSSPPTFAQAGELGLGAVLFAAVGLAVSHGLSFWWNFLRGGEYRRTTPAGLMFAPYRRLVALHLTIIFGALAVTLTGAPIVAVAILVGIKTLIDLGLHLAEHRGVASPEVVLTN